MWVNETSLTPARRFQAVPADAMQNRDKLSPQGLVKIADL